MRIVILIRNMSPKVSVDEEAKKGQFGWFEVVGVQMPYILRSGTSYIPIKVREVLTYVSGPVQSGTTFQSCLHLI